MSVTNYIWDELSDNVTEETDGNGDPIVTYTTRPESYGSTISQRRGNNTSYYFFDAQGSTRRLANNNEVVTDSYSYTAFGETVSESGRTTNPFKYKGEAQYYSNDDTDDIYVRSRNLSPQLGRWISFDPLKFAGGTNFYAYAFNNPTCFYDPSGLVAIPCGLDVDCRKIDLKLNPKEAKNAPWGLVNFADGEKKEGKPFDHLAMGGTAVRQEKDKYPVSCKCHPCEEDKNVICIQCVIDLQQFILIDDDNIKEVNDLMEKMGVDGKQSRRRTYGHEQRHVENNIAAAKFVHKLFVKKLKRDYPCHKIDPNKEGSEILAPHECNVDRKEILSGIVELMRILINFDRAHGHNNPRGRGGYEPIDGVMPKDPSPIPDWVWKQYKDQITPIDRKQIQDPLSKS